MIPEKKTFIALTPSVNLEISGSGPKSRTLGRTFLHATSSNTGTDEIHDQRSLFLSRCMSLIPALTFLLSKMPAGSGMDWPGIYIGTSSFMNE